MTEGLVKPSTLATLKRYGVLAYGTVGTMLDVALMVLGSLLVGLGVAVLLAGFGIVDSSLSLSTGAALVSAVVLAVAGLFCLGLASEGPLGRGRRLVGFKLWEIGVGRMVAGFLVGLAALLVYAFLARLAGELPQPLVKGILGVRAIGVTGVTVMPLLGVPLSLALRFAPVERKWINLADTPILFVVWVVAAMIALP